MKILAIETATRCQSVAIVDDEQILAEDNHPECTSHASALVPTIDRLLKSLNVSLGQLDGLAVSIGPGSFTGLRVGLSTMMGFRVATKLPLVTVSTLEAMAWNLRGENRVVCPTLKASRGEVYWGLFQWEGDHLVRLSDDRHGSLAQLVDSIKGKAVLFGDGWLTSEGKLKELLSDQCIPGPEEAMQPRARSVGFSSLSSFRAKQYAGRQLSPRYVQRAEAEVQWESRVQKPSVIR